MPDKTSHRKPLKILIVGYYGLLNAGDDLLQQAMAYVFQEHALMFCSWTPGVSWMNDCDLVVVGGGSIWPGYSLFQHASALSRRLRVPLMVIGISAKKTADPLLDATLVLAERSPFFQVRDQATHNVFKQSSYVRVGTDLFWWMPWYGRKYTTIHTRPVSVALSLREWPETAWDPHALIQCLSDQALQIRSFPLHLGATIRSPNSDLNDADFLRSLGLTGVTDHFDLNALLQADMCVAMRFHAILMATRLGIPVIGLGFNSKIRAFFNENGLPELCVQLDDSHAFCKAVETVRNNYQYYTTAFSRLADRLEKQGKSDLDACRVALEKIEPHPPQSLIRRIIRHIIE